MKAKLRKNFSLLKISNEAWDIVRYRQRLASNALLNAPVRKFWQARLYSLRKIHPVYSIMDSLADIKKEIYL